jgi:sortase A
MSARSVGVWLERAMFATGFACLAWCALIVGESAWWQRAQRRAVDQTLNTAVAAPARPEPDVGSAAIHPGDPIGELAVPRLHLSAVIVEGDDEASLKVAVGHLPDTPLPWQRGNTAFAAHRDSFFRPLKGIKTGDIVQVSTQRGTLEYRVRETMVVNPEDVWVLDPTEGQTLTLITCYPFSYVGHAPKRFIVRAERSTSLVGCISHAWSRCARVKNSCSSISFSCSNDCSGISGRTPW